MSAILPIGYVTLLQAADILEQSLFSGVPDNPIIVKLREGGQDAGDGAARDRAISEIWKAVDARALRAMAVGGRPRRMVRLDPALTEQIPLLRSPRGRGFTLLRPSNPAFHDLVDWFGPNLGTAALAFREVEIRKLARRLMRTRRRTSRSHDTQERLGRPSRQSAVSTIIREIIEKKKWSPLSGLKALTQNVNRQAKLEFPVSEDTVARALDSLYEKTQDRRFERVRRNRSS